jgi:uncharacterized cupin superfamily protein
MTFKLEICLFLSKFKLQKMMMKSRNASQSDIDSTSGWGIWSKEVSEFPWHYDEKETCYILEGEATVTDNQGNSISFTKGDWVEFEQGLSCTWRITKAIKKRYMFG